MSLSNPGLTKLDIGLKTITFYFFRNRKCEHGTILKILNPKSLFYNWTLRIICIEHFTDDKMSSFGALHKSNRYLAKVSKLVSYIGENDGNTIVGIEGYSFSFGFKKTSSQSTLMELGGIIRMLLSTHGHCTIELSPSNVKNLFCGIGNAKKLQMYECYQNRFHLPKMELLIGLKSDKNKLSNPIEDLVDSFAVAISLLGSFDFPV
jgi:Holliday junction resolvasome RuvABC endonuclease subunit